MMKHLLPVLFELLFAGHVSAQLPYFASTVGDGKLYGYTSLKFRPNTNGQETYTTFQYGLGRHFAVGTDLYTGVGSASWGFLARYGLEVSKWFNVGAEVTPSFNLNRSFQFASLTNALYLNGALTPSGRLFWSSNTWWIVNRGTANTFSNYEYLGYSIPFHNGSSIVPMAGIIHSWKFDQDADLAAGFYYTLKPSTTGSTCNGKRWTIYVWGDDFLNAHPRCIVGVEFVL